VSAFLRRKLCGSLVNARSPDADGCKNIYNIVGLSTSDCIHDIRYFWCSSMLDRDATMMTDAQSL